MLAITVNNPLKEEYYQIEFWGRKDNHFFIKNHNGEGFGMSNEDLFNLLEDYFNKNM